MRVRRVVKYAAYLVSVGGATVLLGARLPFLAGTPVHLTLHEATNIAAALSPDGRTLALSFLGSIWTLPTSGGTAKRITAEYMDAQQPAWSPDGKRIVFQAYRSDTWHVWAVDSDGTRLEQLTSGPYDEREPHWSPDGARIAFSSDRSGNYDVWTLTLATKQVDQITTAPGNDYAPAWSPSGKEIAYVSERRGGTGIYAVTVDAAKPTGERLLASTSGAVTGPSWSPDGSTVAYTVIEAPKSALRVGEKNVADADEDVFPFRPQWLSSAELLYTADGRIKKRSIHGGAPSVVPFTADVSFTRATFTPKHRDFAKAGAQPVVGIMHPAIAPNGKGIAFAALGDLWLMPVDGRPKRITHDPFVEIDPAWSPDSRYLVYSTDRAAPAGSMDLWLRDMTSGSEKRLTSMPGASVNAAWSFDGKRIAFLHDGGELDIITVADTTAGLPHVTARRVEHEPGAPAWSPDGKWIIMSSLHPNSTRFREGTNEIVRIAVDGGPDAAPTWIDPLPHKNIGTREDFGPVWSPDGTQIAAVVDGHLAAFSVDPDGTPTGAVRQLSTDLAESPTWTADSHHILYQTDDRLELVDVKDGSVRVLNPGVTWAVKPAAARTHAVTVIHAGKLWDGFSNSLKADVDIVLEGTRIKSVQPHSAAAHATGRVVDASNETVIPGLIEIHSHLKKSYGESLGRIWLSWGITTVRNPAGNPFEGAEEREAVESGARIGPRTFMAGDPIDGTRIYYPGGTSIDGGVELNQQLARTTRLGYDLMKTYVRLPDLLQKRVIEEAHKRGLPVTSHELYPAVAYGVDGVEHIRGTSRRGYSMKQSQLNRTYDDVVQLVAKSGMTITPTIGIQGGFQLQTIRDASWLADPRLALYPPAALAGSRALAAQQHPQADIDRRVALTKPTEKTVFDIVNAGGRVTAGTDAAINPYGISLLMELEQYVDGGLTPLQALRSATTVPATALGMGGDLGAIAPGRLADLVVLRGNPLANIRDLRNVKIVVKDGEAYTEDELLRKPRSPNR